MLFLDRRQIHTQLAALAERRIDIHRAAVLINRLLHHGQAHTGALLGVLPGAEKRLKDLISKLIGDSRTAVGHFEFDSVVRSDRRDDQFATGRQLGLSV